MLNAPALPRPSIPRGVRFGGTLLVAALTFVGAIAILRPQSPTDAIALRPLPDATVMAQASIGTPPIARTVAFWQARVEASPTDLPSLRLLARSTMSQAAETGDLSLYEIAEQEWRRALDISPSNAESLLGFASARAAQHDFTTAAQLAQQVLDRDPTSVPALIALGDAQFELGRYVEARSTYADLATRVPGSAPALSRMARVEVLDGDSAAAIPLAAAALRAVGDLDLRPSDAAFFWFQLASYELGAGRVDRAARRLGEGLEIDRSHLPSLELLAQVRVEQGRLADAERRYENLVATTPAADLFGLLAKVERARGDTRAAANHEAAGLELGRTQLGRFPAERRHLASFFADAAPAEALEAARTDYAQRQDVQSAGLLAWAEYRAGRNADALRHSREALRFDTADAVLRARGGIIEAAAGNQIRAATLLRSALAVRPHYDLEWAPKAAASLVRLTRAGG